MRLISFALTTPQFLDGSKDVTRRLGWRHLKAGDCLRAVDKCMGFKPGEKPMTLGYIRVVSTRREPLIDIDHAEVDREGFPESTTQWFVDMFTNANKCNSGDDVTRIEFQRITEAEATTWDTEKRARSGRRKARARS